jgi:hypothetical protein
MKDGVEYSKKPETLGTLGCMTSNRSDNIELVKTFIQFVI